MGVSYGHVSNPYPREYASFEPDIDKLRRAAKVGGGELDPEPKSVFAPGDEKIISYEKLQNWFILAALVVYLLDLFVRRVRIFDRKFLPKKRRRGGSLPPGRGGSLPPPSRRSSLPPSTA